MALQVTTSSPKRDVIQHACKKLLKQVEETRRKYTLEVDGLKTELAGLRKERYSCEKETELASITAAAAKRAAADATCDLENLSSHLKQTKVELESAKRYVCS